MIYLKKSGRYKLIETKADIKILYLDKHIYAWVNAKNIGEILVTSHKKHITDAILNIGKYNIYEVTDEPNITDLTHLELEVGDGVWQSYLLLTGLPDDEKIRSRIIPSKTHITNNPHFKVSRNNYPLAMRSKLALTNYIKL